MLGTNFPKARFSRKLTLRSDFLVPRNCDGGQAFKNAVFSYKHVNDGQDYKILSVQQLL